MKPEKTKVLVVTDVLADAAQIGKLLGGLGITVAEGTAARHRNARLPQPHTSCFLVSANRQGDSAR